MVALTGAMIRDAALVNVDISGEVKNLRINGTDEAPWSRQSATVATQTG
jgi:hypothetical protein